MRAVGRRSAHRAREESRAMLSYLLRRMVQAIPLLVLVTIVSFGIMQLSPGGPLTAYAHNPHISAAQLDAIKHNLGLDQPAYIQYLHWFTNLLHGNWGLSLSTGESVLAMIAARLPNTLILVVTAFL